MCNPILYTICPCSFGKLPSVVNLLSVILFKTAQTLPVALFQSIGVKSVLNPSITNDKTILKEDLISY